MAGMTVEFALRPDPLEPLCVVGVGAVARALASRALRSDDASLQALRGVATEDALLLLGPRESLPWVDGVVYLGCDPGAPLLLLPTQRRPTAPVDAFERAILRRLRHAPPPIAVLTHPPRLVSVAEARPVARARLQAWLEGAS